MMTDSEALPSTQDYVPSSPISMPPPMSSPSRRPGSYGLNGQKERRQASITPRKFHRFFEPRSAQAINLGSTRRSLFDITPSTNNRNGIRSSPLRRPGGGLPGQENSPTIFVRDAKRRKTTHTVASLDGQDEVSVTSVFSPRHNDSQAFDQDPFASQTTVETEPSPSKGQMAASTMSYPVEQIERLEDRGIAGRLLQLNLGYSTRSRRQRYVYPVADYQDDTSRFYSTPDDIHSFSTARPGLEAAIPFCTAACNTNTLVAFGDEKGQIRLVESSESGNPPFSDQYLSFQAHSNAIIDLSFSADDALLASGCGDRTVKVTDMATQRTISVFDAHESSVKQVRFQPGSANNSILASSGREGNIFVHDLRCGDLNRPVAMWNGGDPPSVLKGINVNSIIDAHRPGNQQRGPEFQKTINNNWATPAERAQWSCKTMHPREYGPISVTSLAWLPASQSHLLLSGSEINASVKLWDIRSIPRRNELSVPISTTTPPASHSKHRPVGITSICLSTDGARIYTPARDHAVYVYSTSHLILGQAPEFDTTMKPKRPAHTTHHKGPSPLYAFRHPLLMIGTFYVKASLRPARNGHSEMLAVGSTDQCAILFPTDERHLSSPAPKHQKYLSSTTRRDQQEEAEQENAIRDSVVDFSVRSTPRSRKVRYERALAREEDSLLVSQRGTALVEGHGREVSALTWNSDGELVTISDDYLARVWREGGKNKSLSKNENGNDNSKWTGNDIAREMRRSGNRDGKRWCCGWADVVGGYDDDDVEFSDEEDK